MTDFYSSVFFTPFAIFKRTVGHCFYKQKVGRLKKGVEEAVVNCSPSLENDNRMTCGREERDCHHVAIPICVLSCAKETIANKSLQVRDTPETEGQPNMEERGPARSQSAEGGEPNS